MEPLEPLLICLIDANVSRYPTTHLPHALLSILTADDSFIFLLMNDGTSTQVVRWGCRIYIYIY